VVFAMSLLHSPDLRPVAIVGSETGSIFFDRPAPREFWAIAQLDPMGTARLPAYSLADDHFRAQVSHVFMDIRVRVYSQASR